MIEIAVIALLMVVSALLTGITRQTDLAVSCFLFLYLAWHLLHIYIFKRYLNSQRIKKPSKIYGVWSGLFGHLQRLREENLAHKHKHHTLQIATVRCLNIIPDAVMILDRDNVLLWANKAAANLLGVINAEHTGTEIHRLIKDQTLTEHLSNNGSDEYFEILSPVNQSIILSSRVHRTNTRNLDLTVIIAGDITQAFYSQQSRKDFVSNVSHELKTPLTVIKGFLELMSESNHELGKWANSAYLMQTQADRMGKLIDSLLLLSKIQQDQTTNQDKQVNVHDMLLDVIRQAEIAYSEKKQVFTQSISSDLLLVGNESYVYSIFSNLIFNAIIHNAPHCQITLHWQKDDQGRAVFIVDDHGEGIATRHLNRLTERFYRVDKGRTQNPENSTGLGLAIVKHALQYHQADLEISSKTGRGSKFKCIFPENRTFDQPDE